MMGGCLWLIELPLWSQSNDSDFYCTTIYKNNKDTVHTKFELDGDLRIFVDKESTNVRRWNKFELDSDIWTFMYKESTHVRRWKCILATFIELP